MRSKKALINIFSTIILQVVTLLCGFIVPKLIITKFGSNVNGLIASITQFLAYIALLESGFGPVVKAALYKPIANKDKKQIENILRASEKFFRIIAGIFIIYLIILSVIYPLVVNTEFAFFYTMSLVLIISISTLAEYYFGITYKLYLQAEQKTYITSFIQIIGYIVNTIAIVILVKMNYSIQIVKLVGGLIFVLRPITLNFYVKKKYKINLKDADKTYGLKQKWDGLAQHIATVVHNNTDVAVLTIFTPIVEVSVYSVYYMIIKGVKLICQSFTGGIEATFGNMIVKNENEILNKSFKIYEIFYNTLITIIFICTIVLITPFVMVYTKDISDVNYLRPTFATLITLAEFICMVRMPYITLTYSAGHFKQTRKGAWVEAILNIVISVILVNKIGIVGVAIGTLVAMLVRTIEFMYYTSKNILKRKLFFSFEWLLIISIETIILILIDKLISISYMNNYKDWILYAIKVVILNSIFIILFNGIIFRKYIKEIIQLLNNIIRRKK